MKRFTIILLLILLMAASTGIASAGAFGDKVVARGETLDEDVVIYGEGLVVEDGGTVNGDVAVFGGNARLEGEVDGDVSVFGGSMSLSGTVGGDVVLFGGSLSVTDAAIIDGDCVILGGNFQADANATVNCAVPTEGLPGAPFIDGFLPAAPPMHVDTAPVIRVPEAPSFFATFFRDVGEAIGSTITAGLFALVAATVFPQQLARIEGAIRRKPAASGTVGALTGVAAVSLGTILLVISSVLLIVCIGLLGFPIVFGMGLLLAAGVVMGWVALGKMLGDWLAARIKLKNASAVTAATLGTVALTFVLTFLQAIPFVFGTQLVIIVLASVGLGAAALTKLGTRPYPLLAPAGNAAKVDDVLATIANDDIV